MSRSNYPKKTTPAALVPAVLPLEHTGIDHDSIRVGDGVNTITLPLDDEVDTGPSTKVGGKVQDDVSLNAFADGDRQPIRVDTKGRVHVKLEPTALDELFFLDATIQDLSVNNMPGLSGATLEMLFLTTKIVRSIEIVEDVGVFYAIFFGAVGLETLAYIPPLGGGIIELDIPIGTRVSVRGLIAPDTTVGTMAWNLRG